MCVALAALRDPGDIDPSTGSVGYLVAVAVTGVLAAYGNAASVWPLRLVLGHWVFAVSVLVGVEASAVTPAAVGVGLTVVVAGAATAGLVAAVVRIERWSTIAKPRLITRVPLLSPRGNEVLAAVAAGATNAGVAAQLFLSERTVEQHLRSSSRSSTSASTTRPTDVSEQQLPGGSTKGRVTRRPSIASPERAPIGAVGPQCVAEFSATNAASASGDGCPHPRQNGCPAGSA